MKRNSFPKQKHVLKAYLIRKVFMGIVVNRTYPSFNGSIEIALTVPQRRLKSMEIKLKRVHCVKLKLKN